MRTVLILNPGDGTGLNFARCLRDAGGWRTVGLHTNPREIHAGETDVRLLSEWRSPAGLLDAVNAACRANHVDLVYAADTGRELDAISALRNRLTVPTLLPDAEDHLRMEDKWATWEALDAEGCPVPETVLVRDRADLAELFDRHDRIWLRRRRGSAGAGSVPTSSLVFAAAWVEEHGGWGDFTAAECLTTRTATLSGLWCDGELVRSQLRERIGWGYGDVSISGVTGITGAQRTIDDPRLQLLGIDAVHATCARPHGVIGVDFTYDADGQPRITEVQPARFYTSIYFMACLGLNLAADYCKLACDGRDALGAPQLNPCPVDMYWVKGVERLPKILTADEFREVG